MKSPYGKLTVEEIMDLPTLEEMHISFIALVLEHDLEISEKLALAMAEEKLPEYLREEACKN